MAEVRLENVSKSYNKRTIINNLSVTIADGECFTLLGPSGCGKTVILRLIAGFERPDHGEIWLGNTLMASGSRGMSRPPETRGIGVVFQDYAVWPHKTVMQNVLYPLQIQRVPKEQARVRTEEAITTVGLSGLERRLPYQLSGGQQQRVALARALVSRPGIMLLDEPLNNLDANLREDMRFEIKELQRTTGVTILYVTHDQEVALALADRIAVMDSTGSIRQIGTPEEIYESPADSYVFRFMGVSNFVPVEVRKGRAFVRRSSSVLEHDIPASMAGRSDLVIGFRPFDVELTRDRTSLQATVIRSTYLGATFDYRLRLDGATSASQVATGAGPNSHVELRAQQDTSSALASDLIFTEGDVVNLRLHNVKWFSPEATTDTEGVA